MKTENRQRSRIYSLTTLAVLILSMLAVLAFENQTGIIQNVQASGNPAIALGQRVNGTYAGGCYPYVWCATTLSFTLIHPDDTLIIAAQGYGDTLPQTVSITIEDTDGYNWIGLSTITSTNNAQGFPMWLRVWAAVATTGNPDDTILVNATYNHAYASSYAMKGLDLSGAPAISSFITEESTNGMTTIVGLSNPTGPKMPTNLTASAGSFLFGVGQVACEIGCGGHYSGPVGFTNWGSSTWAGPIGYAWNFTAGSSNFDMIGSTTGEGSWQLAGIIIPETGGTYTTTTTSTSVITDTTTTVSTSVVTTIHTFNGNQLGYWFVPLIFILLPGGLFLGFAFIAKMGGKYAFIMFVTGLEFGCLFGLLANVVPLTALIIFSIVYAVILFRSV